MNFTVTLYFETSDSPETDLQVNTNVVAINWCHALAVARQEIKNNRDLNFRINWCWCVVGSPVAG